MINYSGLSSNELCAKIDQELGGVNGKIDLNNQILARKTDGTHPPSTGDKWKTCQEDCNDRLSEDNDDRKKGRGRCKTRCTIAAFIDILDGGDKK